MNLPPMGFSGSSPTGPYGGPAAYAMGGQNRPAHLSPDCAKLGTWIAKCGPVDHSPKGLNYFLILFAIVAGLVILALPLFMTNKGGAVTYLLGGAFLLGGTLGAIYIFFLAPKIEVHAFGMGLVALVNGKERIIPYSSITKLKIREHFEHRGAPMQLLVSLKSNSAGSLSFHSLLEGNARAVIQALASSVENVNYIEFPRD